MIVNFLANLCTLWNVDFVENREKLHSTRSEVETSDSITFTFTCDDGYYYNEAKEKIQYNMQKSYRCEKYTTKGFFDTETGQEAFQPEACSSK